MSVRILAATAIALVVGVAPAEAQQRITYEEALELALSQSTTLARAENAVDAARLGVSGARTSFFPDLRLSVSGDQSYGRSFSQDEGTVLNETNESLSGRGRTSSSTSSPASSRSSPRASRSACSRSRSPRRRSRSAR